MLKRMRCLRIYRRRGEWRWQIRSANNRIVDASSEGFKTRRGCLNNFLRTCAIMRLFIDEARAMLAEKN